MDRKLNSHSFEINDAIFLKKSFGELALRQNSTFIKIWNLKTKKEVHTAKIFDAKNFMGMSFEPSNKLCIIPNEYNIIHVNSSQCKTIRGIPN